MYNGVDISGWNPDINFRLLKANGVSFVYVKATEGDTYVYPDHDDRITRARNHKLRAGSYHFARPGVHPTPYSHGYDQALFFLKHAYVRNYQLRPALDLEADGGLSQAQLRQWLRGFRDAVKHYTGRLPVVYTGPWFWEYYVGHDATVLKSAPLWIAHYGVSSPTVPGQWKTWTMWQWGGKTYPGTPSKLDADKAKRFPRYIKPLLFSLKALRALQG